MKKWTHVSLGVFFVALLSVSATAELKIGFINSEEVFQNYEGTQEAQDQFNKEVAKWEQLASEKQKEIQELKEKLEKQSLLLSSERKKELEQQLQEKMVAYQRFLQEKFGQQGEAIVKNEELTRPIIEKINEILKKIAKEENYDYILDQRAGGVIFARESYDLTQRVITQLNKDVQ